MVAQRLTSALLAASFAFAGPLPAKRTIDFSNGFGPSNFGFDSSFHGSSSHEAVHLSSWHGIQSLDNFDDFYGFDNFCGFETSLTQTTVIEQKEEVVCRSVSVEIIQQQLAVIREYVRQIITTQICEVETQTIVFSQFQASIYGFGEDIRHVSGRPVGYDSAIASHIVDLHDDSGALNGHDLGFSGSDIGNSFVAPSGFNWNDQTSPDSVGAAFSAASSAAGPGVLSSDTGADSSSANPNPASD